MCWTSIEIVSIYLYKENNHVLCIYDSKEEKQRVTAEEIIEFIKRDENI